MLLSTTWKVILGIGVIIGVAMLYRFFRACQLLREGNRGSKKRYPLLGGKSLRDIPSLGKSVISERLCAARRVEQSLLGHSEVHLVKQIGHGASGSVYKVG